MIERRDGEERREEHHDVIEARGSIKGQLSILLKLMVVLVAGMAYAITQNHSTDIQLVRMDNRLANTEMILGESKSSHNIRLVSLENSVESISALCCTELDEYKEEY